MARNFGCRASGLLKIRDEILAFDFDRLCSFRLLKFDNERAADQMKIYFKTLGFMFTGKKPEYGEMEKVSEDDVW